jgi:hypothetical protein
MAAPAETIDQIRTTVIDLALKFGPKVLAALVILTIGYLVGRQMSCASRVWRSRCCS